MILRVSHFTCDVTAPLGHPLMFGGIPPARKITDSQLAKGIILRPDHEAPVVLLALDWCEIRNEGYDQFRDAIAGAVGTTRERVAVHCVHQHAAVYADPEAEKKLREYRVPTSSMDLEFFDRTCHTITNAARTAAGAKGEVIDRVGTGQGQVREVASNRRMKGPDGKLLPMRTSACTDESLRAEPEGLIDPLLKTITLWSGDRLMAALHYYATHPMSHYRDGSVSKDFCGMAREAIEEETGGVHLYFTGCAGNVAAGKYNDGSPGMRPVLRDRIIDGMRAALQSNIVSPVEKFSWHSIPVHLPTRPEFTEEWYTSLLSNAAETHNTRYRGAAGLTWRARVAARRAIDFSCLVLNDARVLHLPGEPFVEYQLYAQQARPDRFVAAAPYGDCGPGYIPTREAYAEGGYEAGPPALVAPEADSTMRASIDNLLQLAD